MTDILVDTIGWIKKEEVPPDVMLATDLKVDGDDLTLFAMFIEKYFGLNIPQSDWDCTGTIEKTADIVLEHLAKKEAMGIAYFDKPARPGIIDNLKAWICGEKNASS